MRLDKLLAHSGFGTRKQVKKIIKDGYVVVNNKEINSPKTHVDPDTDEILVGGQPIHYEKYTYLIMNKPAGVITATEDPMHETVIDLLEPQDLVQDLHPIGRLDIDTEGLLLLTNDGQLTHRLTSPNHETPKTYYAEINGLVTKDDVQKFKDGLDLGDFTARPADLEVLSTDKEEEISEILVTISEGKFHQVKRMFQAVEKEVTYLKRIQMGPIKLSDDIIPGSYRELNEAEYNNLKPYMSDK